MSDVVEPQIRDGQQLSMEEAFEKDIEWELVDQYTLGGQDDDYYYTLNVSEFQCTDVTSVDEIRRGME